MAGYGNRTAPNYLDPTVQDERTSTKLGLSDSHSAYSNPHTHGSGATGGAGFGNKRSSLAKSVAALASDASDASSSRSDFHFHHLHDDTAPYSHATEHGSGSTGGAGFGNKTGSFGESHDSAVGKALEKAGGMVKSEGLVDKGRIMRVDKGFGEGQG